MIKVAAYIRVSTSGQVGDDKFGLESQKESIQKYCDRNGYEIIKWFKDEGESGAKERPGFDEIIYGEVSNPPYEKVIVAKSDRVARDINVYYYYKMMLRKKNVLLVSITEDFGQYGVFGNMLEAFTLCAAEMERNNITKRTASGRRIKANRGGYSGGKVPMGYKVIDGRLIIEPKEAEIVKIIFNMHDSGKKFVEIISELKGRGYTTRSGGDFVISTLHGILNRRKMYEGYYKYGNGDWVKGEHEAILEEDKFYSEENQQAIKESIEQIKNGKIAVKPLDELEQM